MRNPQSDILFRRAIVVLDATCESYPALRSAASVARQFDAELMALFVEDPQLIDLEAHPLARAIDLPTGLGHSITQGSMRRHCRALERRLQRQLQQLSRHFEVAIEFESIRGDDIAKLSHQFGASDLLVVERTHRHLTKTAGMLPSKSRRLAGQVEGPVFFVGGTHQVHSVVTVFDGSPLSRRSLHTALQLGSSQPMMLTALLVAATEDEAAQRQDQLRRLIRQRETPIHLHTRRILDCTPKALVSVASNVHAQLLILPDTDHRLCEDTIDVVTNRLDCPILVVRGGDTGPEEAMRRQITSGSRQKS